MRTFLLHIIIIRISTHLSYKIARLDELDQRFMHYIDVALAGLDFHMMKSKQVNERGQLGHFFVQANINDLRVNARLHDYRLKGHSQRVMRHSLKEK